MYSNKKLQILIYIQKCMFLKNIRICYTHVNNNKWPLL